MAGPMTHNIQYLAVLKNFDVSIEIGSDDANNVLEKFN